MGLEIAKVGFIEPVLEGLKSAGVNPQALLHASGLNRFRLDDPENYIPVSSMYAFFDAVCKREASNDLLEMFSDRVHLAALSQFGEMVAHMPNVLTACQAAVKYDRALLSHERAGFEVSGKISRYWQYYTDHPVAGREQTDFLDLVMALDGFRLAGGPDWTPMEIHLQSKSMPNLDKLLPPGNDTRVLTGQPATAIVFPTSMLAMPMLRQDIAPGYEDYLTNTPASQAGRIRQLFDSLDTGQKPGIRMIAEVMDLSPRTLQRLLAEEDTTLSEVLDQWRFKTAVELLDDSGLRVKDISQRLFYSNTPNFERAFRRWTGTSPNQYRDAH